MKVVFMGTPDFAVGALEAVIQAGHQVSAVVTQPDKQKGRGKEVQFSPVKECALRHSIPVFQPVKIKAPEAVAELKQYPADIFIVAAFGQILSQEILDMPKYGCLNIHASLLPKYRGAAPIQWAIMNGEERTGVTIMQMDAGLDTGDMLLKSEVVIETKETGESLHDKLSAAGADLIVNALELVEKGELKPEKQDDKASCYARMLTKELGKICWEEEAVKIERLIRGLNSWPSAYTQYHGKTLKIWDADAENEITAGEPGTVTEVGKDFLRVNTGKGSLKITSVQLEGKKRMAVRDFLLGNVVTAGERLGGM